MKYRTPGSFEDALYRIGKRLGWDETARIANRTVRTVRDWSEPDTRRTPPIDTAAALDRAWVDAGGLGSPLRDALDRALARPSVVIGFNPAAVADATCVVIREGAEAKLALLYASRPDACPQVRRDTAREVQEAIDAYTATLPLLAVPCSARGPPAMG